MSGGPREFVEVLAGVYRDSVTLMRVSRSVGELSGIDAAMAAMGTELNLEVLARMGFAVPDGAGPADLVVAVRTTEDGTDGDDAANGPDGADGANGPAGALERAREALDGLLRDAGPGAGGGVPFGEGPPARTTASAAARADANLALLSVPGPHVFPEAMDALDAGLNVMIFSDNVPLDQEVALKEAAARRGLLVMGPTAGRRWSAARASGSPTRCGRAPSASSRRPAPARSSSCACWTRRASASGTCSASAGATCRPPSAGARRSRRSRRSAPTRRRS
ncbi:hypothetical protein [Actinomadura sp. J1-007]|uniref:hypothetical protein n=1 Tax=Actinomadura sp. J1-007 TaxID=2661913 RepID=UPI0028158C0C|nr:hypothetical protein [Actinomadura sp. J1-007]